MANTDQCWSNVGQLLAEIGQYLAQIGDSWSNLAKQTQMWQLSAIFVARKSADLGRTWGGAPLPQQLFDSAWVRATMEVDRNSGSACDEQPFGSARVAACSLPPPAYPGTPPSKPAALRLHRGHGRTGGRVGLDASATPVAGASTATPSPCDLAIHLPLLGPTPRASAAQRLNWALCRLLLAAPRRPPRRTPCRTPRAEWPALMVRRWGYIVVRPRAPPSAR